MTTDAGVVIRKIGDVGKVAVRVPGGWDFMTSVTGKALMFFGSVKEDRIFRGGAARRLWLGARLTTSLSQRSGTYQHDAAKRCNDRNQFADDPRRRREMFIVSVRHQLQPHAAGIISHKPATVFQSLRTSLLDRFRLTR